MLDHAITTYLAEPTPGRALLLAIPAGGGKTTKMVQIAERTAAAGGRRVLYAGPRHDFYQDIQALAGQPSWWYEWKPRTLGGETTAATCRWAPQMERWQHRGYMALDFCKNPHICGWSYLQKDCPYHAQRRITQPIIYAQHQHVALRHPLMEQAGLLIGDELPLSAFLHPWTIPAGAIVLDGAAPDLHQLLWTLRALCATPAPKGQGGWSGPALLAELGGAAYVAALCEAHGGLSIGAELLAPQLRHPDAVDEAEYGHLPYLLSLLAQEAQASLDGMPDYVRRVRATTDGLTLLMRRRPGPLPEHIIWCDATGDGALYERLLGMPVKVVRPNVPLAGTVRQVWASLNNKAALAGTPEGDEDRQAQLRKRVQLQAQIGQILNRGYERPALITYKALRAELGAGLEGGHFGAERGTNRLAECDGLIVVGTPQPPTPQIVDMAAMLYDRRMEPFNTTWSVRDIPYTGQDKAWPIGGFWDDPELQTLLEQLRDAELMQAVHRARPLRRQVDVWLLTNAPVDGLPVELVSLNALFDAPEGVDPYGWPALRAWVADRVDTVGRATVPEIAEAAGVKLAAARRYADALAAQDGYDLVRAPAAGRGQPPLALVKR